MKKSKVHTVYFEASKKMGIAWKGNVVHKVFPGTQAHELGVRAGYVAIMINARQIPSGKGLCGDKMRHAISKGKNFTVIFREIVKFEEIPQDAKSSSPRAAAPTTATSNMEEEVSQLLLGLDKSSSLETQTQYLRRCLQRDFNCVTDPVAAKRRHALKKLRATTRRLIENTPTKSLLSSLFRSELRLVLFRAVNKDPKDTCREIALSTLVIVSGDKTLNDATFLKETTRVLTQRMGKKPFLEDSEELRLLLLKLLNNLLSSSSCQGVVSQLLDDLRTVLRAAVRCVSES